jgi:rhamnogalacturonan endolyase
MIGDFIPGVPGLELYAAEQDGTGKWIYSAATGHLLGEEDLGGLSPRPLWWDETTTKAHIPGRMFGAARGGRGSGGGFPAGPSAIMRYGAGKIGEFEGRLVSIADVVGDWREEIIVSVPGELRIYTTTIPTPRRRPALMQDPLYRKDVALQTMGYFYPAQLSYHFR